MAASYSMFLGVTLAQDVDGGIVGTLPSSERTGGAVGILHGGSIAALLEFVSADLIRRSAGDSVPCKPIGVNIDFLRAGLRQDTFARAVVQRIGKRVANVVATAWQDGETKPIAVARTIYSINRSPVPRDLPGQTREDT